MTFFDLSTSRIVSIIITKNIGMLHIKWKLKQYKENMSQQVWSQMTDLRLTLLTLDDLKT